MFLVRPAIVSSVAGAAVSYFFHRHTLDKAGFQTLAKASLPIVGVQVISNLFGKSVAKYYDKESESTAQVLSAIALTIGAMYYCNWSKTEAAVMLVASSILSSILSDT